MKIKSESGFSAVEALLAALTSGHVRVPDPEDRRQRLLAQAGLLSVVQEQVPELFDLRKSWCARHAQDSTRPVTAWFSSV